MFGKLLKYEFKTVGKWYLALYGVAATLSIALGFWMQSFINQSVNSTNSYEYGYGYGSSTQGILFGFAIVAFMLTIFALMTSTFLMNAFRFKNNVYGRQGYLTMTLPVTSHQILLSKLLASLIWYMIAAVGVFLCFIAMTSIALLPIRHEIPFHEVPKLISEILSSSFWLDYNGWMMIPTTLLEVPVSILCVYFAISLGQLFKDHRTVLAVAFYIAINFGTSLISTILFLPSWGTAAFLVDSTGAYGSSMTFVIALLIQIGLGLFYYFGSHYIMTKKLNLQ